MPPFRVPPVPGLTERLDQGGGGPLDSMVHTTARSLVEKAISLLRKAAALDPMLRGKIADALVPFGASIPEEGDDGDEGEPMRPRGLQSPSRNY